jgi:hypothetical protein
MKVLIGCEESQVVCKAFREKGHEAYSCDIIDCSGGHPEWHIKDDILNHLNDGYDLAIFFPPCTHLCVSGARWFTEGKKDIQLQIDALDFVNKLLNAPIPKIALENPVGAISTKIRKPDQIIQPYDFGDDASKRTCLWLKNLPKLVPTKYIEPKIINGKRIWANQTPSGQNNLGPSEDRAKERSKTYEGIAKCMADTWG